VGLHTCTAVARSLCVSWAFLLVVVVGFPCVEADTESFVAGHKYEVRNLCVCGAFSK